MSPKRVASLLIALCLATASFAKPQYLFVYFQNGNANIHYAVSEDGLQWETVENSEKLLSAKPLNNCFRDPSICQGPDGTYHLVWTSAKTQIGYSKSKDLIHWDTPKYINVMKDYPKTKSTWAPELFYDKETQLFYILWASTVEGAHPQVPTSKSESWCNHRIYACTTADFQTFSESKLYFCPQKDIVIDAFIYQHDKHNYYLFYKNENSAPPEKNIRYVTTTSLSKGFPQNETSPKITGDNRAEGPSAIKIKNNIYVYFDKYTKGQYGVVRSHDGQNWEDISSQLTMPKGARHGTIIKTKKKVIRKLQKHCKTL